MPRLLFRCLFVAVLVAFGLAAGNATPRFLPFTLDWPRAFDGEPFVRFDPADCPSSPGAGVEAARNHLAALDRALTDLHAQDTELASDIALQERMLQILQTRSDPSEAIEASLLRHRARAPVLVARIARATDLRDRLHSILETRSPSLSPALRAAQSFLLAGAGARESR